MDKELQELLELNYPGITTDGARLHQTMQIFGLAKIIVTKEDRDELQRNLINVKAKLREMLLQRKPKEKTYTFSHTKSGDKTPTEIVIKESELKKHHLELLAASLIKEYEELPKDAQRIFRVYLAQ